MLSPTRLVATVAIVGRPNVGKSTLFNRLGGRRRALTADEPGVTRDCLEGRMVVADLPVRIVDTGGMAAGEGPEAGLAGEVTAAAAAAAAAADAVLLVVDGRAGCVPEDAAVAARLRRAGCTFAVLVNKADTPSTDALVADFYRLGGAAVVAVSAEHGRGMDDLHDYLTARLAAALPPATLAAGVAAARQEAARAAAAPRRSQRVPASAASAPSAPSVPARASAKSASASVPAPAPDASAAFAASAPPPEAPAPGAPAAVTAFATAASTPEASWGAVADPILLAASTAFPGAQVALSDDAVAALDAADAAAWEAAPVGPIRVAVVGRPNAGKSSLINRLLGAPRHLATPVAGTTRDPVDSAWSHGGRDFTFIDTAGIRRKRGITARLEQLAVSAAFSSLDRCDVAVLVLDASLRPSEQDARIAGMALEKGCGLILALNKWDLIENPEWRERFVACVAHIMPFAEHVPRQIISAATGRGTTQLVSRICAVHAARDRRIGTGTLNRLIRGAVAAHPPPMVGGKRPQFYFVSQPLIRPPTFVFATSRAEDLHFSYQRYLINALRDAYDFAGTPIWLKFRSHGNPARVAPPKVSKTAKAARVERARRRPQA